MTPHFSRSELACRHCGEVHFSQSTLDRLERVRVKCGFPFNISSGYRCPTHNAAVSTTGANGPHTHGAVDIAIRGAQALTLVRYALAEGFTGIGVNQKGDARFIHLDDLPDAPGQPRPTIWSY